MNNIENEIKQLIINCLNLEDIKVDDIKNDEALFGEGLGLDSIDALELGMALQKKYNLKIDSPMEDIKKHFFSVQTIATFIRNKKEGVSNDKG
jgi:acyl carrier protein